jgi:hypothetical protein
MIESVSGGPLVLGNMTIESGSDIAANDLQVTAHLRLNGDSRLAGVNRSEIELVNESVDVELVASGDKVPFLDLGFIGDSYVVPHVLKVVAPEGLTPEQLTGFERRLVSGETLLNCEEWRRRIDMPSGSFTAEYRQIARARLLADELTLWLIGHVSPETTLSMEESDGNVGLIAGIVVTIVVIGALGVIIVIFLQNRKERLPSSSGDGRNKGINEEV